MGRRTVLAAFVAAAAGLLSCAASVRAGWDQGVTVWSILNARSPSGVQLVDADRDLQDALARIGENIRTQRLDEAVDGLQSLIGAERPVLFPRWDDSRRYIPGSEVATRILGLLPADAVERFARQNEGAARRYFDEASRDLREDLLVRTGRQYFHTPSGADALNLCAALAFDRGDFLNAAYLWGILYFEQRSSRLDRPLLLAKAAVAAHMGGWKRVAADMVAMLNTAHPGATAVIGGKEQKVTSFVRQALAGAVPAPAQVPVAERWCSVAGVADGFAAMPECAVSALPLWKQPEAELTANVRDLLRLGATPVTAGQTRVEARTAVGRVRVVIGRPGEEEFSFDLPSLVHPLVLGDRIVCRREGGLSAVALETGRELWKTRYPVCRGDLAGRTLNHYLPLEGDVGRYAASAGEGMVFAVGMFRRIDPDTYSKFATTLGVDSSSLAAFSETDGKMVWEVGIGKGDSEVLRNAKYLTAPTCHQGRLYVMAKCGNRYQAICLDARTGRRIWDVPVGPIPTHAGEQMSWQAAYTMEIMTERASAPSVAHGVVYITTHTGLVMALEAATGAPLWAYRYDSRVSTASDMGRSFEVANMAFLIAASRHPFPPQNPVLIVRGRVIVAPADSDAVLAFHGLSGEPLWQVRRQGRRDLSAVDESRVLLSGPDLVFVSVSDGAVLKQVDAADVEDRPAVTRTAVIAGGAGRLLRVGLSDYSVSVQESADGEAVLGRLVGSGGRLVAANAAGLSVYLGFDDAWETLSRRLKESSGSGRRMELLLQRGILAFHAGKTAVAVTEFRSAEEVARGFGGGERGKARQWLSRSLLRMADESGDGDEVERCLDEAEAVAGEENRSAVMLARVRCRERLGRFESAVAAAQTVCESGGVTRVSIREQGPEGQPSWMTGHAWGRDRIAALIRSHGRSVYARFDALMDAALDRGRRERDVTALVDAWRRWPNAKHAGDALYAAAGTMWSQSGPSPDAALAARVDRMLGEIDAESLARKSADRVQLLIDSMFRPTLVSSSRIAAAGSATNTSIEFGDYHGTLEEVVERARLATARFPVGTVSFAGVTGTLSYAWGLAGDTWAVLRTGEGAPALESDRRICLQDESSVRCVNVQRSGDGGRGIWSVGVGRVVEPGARRGYYCADRDRLAILGPEQLVVVSGESGIVAGMASLRELGVYPWTDAVGDGARLLVANGRQGWVASIALDGVSVEWVERLGAFDTEGMRAASDLVMVRRVTNRNQAWVLDARNGRQILGFDRGLLGIAMNGDGFVASLEGERGIWLGFHDPRLYGRSLLGRAALTNTVSDLVAFGPRHAVVQEKRNGLSLRLIDIADQSEVGVSLYPGATVSRVVLGVAWAPGTLLVASGGPANREGLAPDIFLDAVNLKSGAARWSVGVSEALAQVRGMRVYGGVVSMLVVPRAQGVPAKRMLLNGLDGNTAADFGEPFGVPPDGRASVPEWAAEPVVLNGRVVLDSASGILCFSEPL